MSETSSRGRKGYGTQYKLKVSPEMAGLAISEQWWKDMVKSKIDKESMDSLLKSFEKRRKSNFTIFSKTQSLSANLERLKKKYNIT